MFLKVKEICYTERKDRGVGMAIDPVVLQLFSQSFASSDKETDAVTKKALQLLKANTSCTVHTNYEQHTAVRAQYGDVKTAFLTLAQVLGRADLEQLVNKASFTETISGLDEYAEEQKQIQALFASISESDTDIVIQELKHIREKLQEKCGENYDEHILTDDICALEEILLQKQTSVNDFISCLRKLQPKNRDFIPQLLLQLSLKDVHQAKSVDDLIDCYLHIVNNFQHIPPEYLRAVSKIIPDLHAVFLARFEPPGSNRTYTEIARGPIPAATEVAAPKPVLVRYKPGIKEIPSATRVDSVYREVMGSLVAIQGVLLVAAYQHFTQAGFTIHEITYALGFCVLVTAAQKLMRQVAPERAALVIWGLWVAQALLYPVVMPKIDALSGMLPTWSQTDYAFGQAGLVAAAPLPPTCPLFVERPFQNVLSVPALPPSCYAEPNLLASFVPNQAVEPALPPVCYLSGAFESFSKCIPRIQSTIAATLRR